MRRRSLVQRIATEHNTMEDIGYAVETLELARGAIIDSLCDSKLLIGDILPKFTAAARAKKLEWLESARSLLDSRKLVYLSSFQREVFLSEGLKQEQLRHYEERIDESIAAQERLLRRIYDVEDARILLADLAVNFTEKLRQYQATLEAKTQNIDLLEAKDDSGEWGVPTEGIMAGQFVRPRRKRTFYLGDDSDDGESDEEDESEAEVEEEELEREEGEKMRVGNSRCGLLPSIVSLGSAETLPDQDVEDNGCPVIEVPEGANEDEDEEEVYLSFGRRPPHSREDSSCYDPAADSSSSNNNNLFDNPRYKLDLERSLSPVHHGKFREQLRGFAPLSPSAASAPILSVSQPPVCPQSTERTDDLIRLFWACERALPYQVYQVLFFTKPERRGSLANAASTPESLHGPLHAACLQGHSLIVKILLTFGADPALVSSEGRSPLHYASESGNLELISILLATAKGDPEKTARLLEGPLIGKSGFTPLTTAALRGNVPLAKELLTRAENLPSPLGPKLTKRLLKTVCTLQAQGLRGSPLEIATASGHREMVLFLLNQGAEPLVKEVEYTMAHPTSFPCVTIGVKGR